MRQVCWWQRVCWCRDFQEKNPEAVSARDVVFNSGWKFIRDSVPGAENPGFDDSGWLTVDLPHDYSIMDLPGEDGPDRIGPFSGKSPGNGNSTGHVIGGEGWYRKRFVTGKKDRDKTVNLKFDGVYMESDVWMNGRKGERVSRSFGIRSVEFSAEKGFLLNGKPLELKGACLHHDDGLLGSAAIERAEERKVELMKSAGFNAIRCSHNPPSEVFLDACDRLGMLVIDEF